MSRGGFLSRFPVLGIRDFRLLLTDRLIAPASVGVASPMKMVPRTRKISAVATATTRVTGWQK